MKVRLGDICEVISGSTPKTNVPEYWNGTLKWITPAEIGKECYIFDSERHISEEGAKSANLRPLPPGTVILSSRAPIGKTAIAGCKLYCNQGFKNLICSSALMPEYLYYFLSCNTHKLNLLGRGATFKELSKSIVENIEIPLINLIQQKYIVHILQNIDRLITKYSNACSILNEIVKSRFMEMFGDLSSPSCRWNKNKLSHICVNYDDIKCGPFGTQLNKNEYTATGVPIWEIAQINSMFTTKPVHFITQDKAVSLNAYSIKPGDIAMSRKGNVGRCAIFPETLQNGIIHSDILRIRVDQNQVLPVFIVHQLRYSNHVKHQIELVSSGAIMAGINVTKLKQIEIHIPPLPLQQQFAAFVEKVDKSKFIVGARLAGRLYRKVLTKLSLSEADYD